MIEKFSFSGTFSKITPENDNNSCFSDRKGPDSLSWLTGYGVIGLYLSVTLLCGRYTRAIFQYDGAYILFHEYPNVDALLQLCLGGFNLEILEFLNILQISTWSVK